MDAKRNIPEIISDNAVIFNSFKHVFLFGSALSPQAIPNDVDILLIYTEYTADISKAIKYVSYKLELLLSLPIDITALSTEEERETEFLKKLNLNFISIK